MNLLTMYKKNKLKSTCSSNINVLIRLKHINYKCEKYRKHVLFTLRR